MGEHQHNYQFMFDKIPYGVFFRNADGSMSDINPAAAEIFGVSREILELHNPYLPDQPVILENGTILLPEQFPSMVSLHSGKEVRDFVVGLYNPLRQEYLWLNVNSFPQFRDGDQFPCRVLVTLHDITTEKKENELLRQGEDRNRALLNIAGTGYVILDAAGRVLDANSEYVRLSGHEHLQQILGRPVTDWTAAYDLERNAAAVIKCVEQGYVQNLEIDYQHRDGTCVPLEINASTIQTGEGKKIVTLCRDISERRLAAQAIQRSEERYRAIVNTQTEFVDRFIPGGIITFINDALCNYVGIPREELLGRSFFDFVHEEERERLVLSLQELTPENPTLNTTGRVVLPDGSLHWHEWSNHAIFDREGHVLEYQSVGRDITEQKIAEAELAYANECFAQALDGPGHILYRLDVNKGYDYISPSFEIITGHQVSEFKNNSLLTLKEFFHPDDRERIFASIDAAFSTRVGKTVNFDLEYRLRKADGDYCWLHDLNTACFNENDELVCFFGSAYDITGRKMAEELLRASEERFRSIMALSPDIISIITADGVLAYNSPATFAIHGYTEEDLAGRNTFELIHPDDQPLVSATMQKLFDLPSQTQSVQYRYRDKDGTYRWMEATASNHIDNPNIGGLIVISRDISRRKQMEAGLRLSEERYRRFIATANEGIGITDKDYVITYVNNSFAEMLGYAPEELIGVPVDRLLHPDEQNGFRLQAESRRHGISGRRECGHLHKDGSQVWLLTSSSPVMDDAGEFQGCFAMFTDLSDRKKVETALQKANDELEVRVAERTAALGKAYEQIKRMTFELIRAEERERMRIAGELHDQVGQSLLLIKMKLDMLASEIETEPLRDTATAISFLLECSLQDIRSLTFNMRPPLLETAGLSAALEWLCTAIGRDYGLLVDFTSCGPPFSGDIEVSHSIYQAVRELLLNVVKHAGVSRSELFMEVDAAMIVVRVADSGVGLDRPVEARKHDDSGFGLFNVQQRIEQLGGSFCIESAPGSGTVVTLNIPLQGYGTKEDA